MFCFRRFSPCQSFWVTPFIVSVWGVEWNSGGPGELGEHRGGICPARPQRPAGPGGAGCGSLAGSGAELDSADAGTGGQRTGATHFVV